MIKNGVRALIIIIIPFHGGHTTGFLACLDDEAV